jgi:hypothetical protein
MCPAVSRRVPDDMCPAMPRGIRQPRRPGRAADQASAIAAYENFLYLPSEMEASLARGTIQWTAGSAQEAQRRSVNMFAELDVIAVRLRED